MELATSFEVLTSTVKVAGARVIDVGCGAGAMVRELRRVGADVVGVECGEAMRSQALAADPEHGGDYIDGVGQDLPFDDDSADLITMFSSLHHVPAEHMAAALDEALRVLRPGATLWVSEPVASGPSFDTGRLVDDETVVRGLAQAALDAIDPSSCAEAPAQRHETEYRYQDFDAYEATVVGIDPTRRERMNELRDEVQARFRANGDFADGVWRFRQPMLVRRFTAS